jgi:hypothetical protein
MDPKKLEQSPATQRVLLFYLVRGIIAAVSKDRVGERRYRGLAAELKDALLPIIVAKRHPMGFANALANRFRVDLAGGEDSYPVELCTPDWHMRWDRAVSALDYSAMRSTIEENPAFVAQFAVGFYETVDDLREDHELIIEYDLPDAPDAFTVELPGHDVVRPREYTAVWTLLSPLAHGADEKCGNAKMFRREHAYDAITGRFHQVPFIAGNAVRGAWRDMVMGRWLELIGLSETELPPSKAHALLAGGSVAAGSDTGVADPVVRAEARELCPAWDLFAGCIEQQIMSGRARVGDATLVCRENAWRVGDALAPGEDSRELACRLPEASNCTSLRLGTRQAHKDIPESDGSQMLFNTEVLVAGCQMVHRVALCGLSGISDVTQACLSDLLSAFAESPYVGAQASHGFGKVAFAPYQPQGGAPELQPPSIYLEYVARRREEMREWAMRPAVQASTKKAAKRGKGKRSADTANSG